jgi:hypothetical protein
MTDTDDRLFSLLPRVHQRRDEEMGGPLQALLAVITEQADLLDADIQALYGDWFIETCQDWIVPYLGDLVGYRILPGGQESLAADSPEARKLLSAIASRRDVAHTVANRRRKGTLALLEQLALDVAGWPSRAVEFRRLLSVTPAIRLYGHDPRADARRLRRGNLVDVRHGDALDRLDGPFDSLAHLVDVRRINSPRGTGKFNIPEIGLYVWRLRPYSVTYGPAYCEDRARAQFTFSILGNDAPLITNPEPEPAPTHIADEANVPAFIRRRAFAEHLSRYYGPGKSLCVYTGPDQPVPLNAIVPADLSGWRYLPARGQVAIDPVLGRIAFPSRSAPDNGVWVDYHYGFSDDLGGGEYTRPVSPRVANYVVGEGYFESIMAAVQKWQEDKKANPAASHQVVIELADSGSYQEQIDIKLDHGDHLTLRAAQHKRPVIRLLDWYSNRPDALRITGPEGCEGHLPTVILDGVLITGRGVRVQGQIGTVVIRHSTLVPGWSLDCDCNPEHSEEASVELFDTPACLQVERSILGTVLVDVDEVHNEPNQVWLSDSILDSAGWCLPAITAPNDRHAHAVFSARRVTVFGAVRTHAVNLVENSILMGEVCVARRQQGCIRFCWLLPGSRVPGQFHCEPAHSNDPVRVIPRFTSTRYGTPGYGQLAPWCPDEISRGAEDGSEMGAFHDLFQPQREDNLRARLDEYTPAGTDANFLFAT